MMIDLLPLTNSMGCGDVQEHDVNNARSRCHILCHNDSQVVELEADRLDLKEPNVSPFSCLRHFLASLQVV